MLSKLLLVKSSGESIQAPCLWFCYKFLFKSSHLGISVPTSLEIPNGQTPLDLCFECYSKPRKFFTRTYIADHFEFSRIFNENWAKRFNLKCNLQQPCICIVLPSNEFCVLLRTSSSNSLQKKHWWFLDYKIKEAVYLKRFYPVSPLLTPSQLLKVTRLMIKLA